MESTELTVIPRGGDVQTSDFMPLLTVDQAVERKRMMNEYIGKVLKEGEDYGPMPGNPKDRKKVLLKPGAEKLCSIFGLAPRYVKETIVEDWTGAQHGGEPLFYYEYRCQLYRGDRFMGEAIGSCNTWEAKYRYRWVREEQIPEGLDKAKLLSRGGKRTLFEPNFALEKRETTGKYGKPMTYWNMFDKADQDGTARRTTRTSQKGKEMHGWEIDVDETLYRVPNDNPAELINTCQKIAQKRALVAANLVVTNCSDAFTQDLEDTPEFEHQLDASGDMNQETEQRNTPEQQKDLAEKRAGEAKAARANGTPIELKPFYDAIDRDIENFKAACDHFYKRLSDKGGEGAKAYDRIARLFTERYPDGTKNPAPLKALINDLYQAYQALPDPANVKLQDRGNGPTEAADLFTSEPARDTVAK